MLENTKNARSYQSYEDPTVEMLKLGVLVDDADTAVQW